MHLKGDCSGVRFPNLHFVSFMVKVIKKGSKNVVSCQARRQQEPPPCIVVSMSICGETLGASWQVGMSGPGKTPATIYYLQTEVQRGGAN